MRVGGICERRVDICTDRGFDSTGKVLSDQVMSFAIYMRVDRSLIRPGVPFLFLYMHSEVTANKRREPFSRSIGLNRRKRT